MRESIKKPSKLDNFKDKRNSKPFTDQDQPTGAQKSAGWLRRKRGQELAAAILNLAFKGAKNSELKKAAAEYYGVPEKEITVEQMMLFRQAEKAIQKADTAAFNAIMDRTHGKPPQPIEGMESTIQILITEEVPKTNGTI